jgi:hypothetical protein
VSVRLRIAVLAAIALVSVAAFLLLAGEPRTPASSGIPVRTPAATVERPTLPDAVSYRDHEFDPDVVPSPTASKSQSKLWFAHGAWWGLLHEPRSDELHIYRLEADGSHWVDTGTLVDERPLSRGDALAVGDQLYVAAAGRRARPDDAVRLVRFTFRDGTYRLDADFPVPLSQTGVESVVLARDTAERLWITYTLDRQVWVRASEGDDHRWGPAFTPAVEGTTVAPDDIAALVSFDEAVGLMWSNQSEDTVLFSIHRDDDPVDAWSPSEVVSRGEKQPDDHINMKSDADGRVYAALKTSLDTLPNANPLAPQIILAIRDGDGVWRENVVARLKDRHTRPIVLIDEQLKEVYVVATAPSAGGAIYYKRSSLDDVSFETGRGSLLIGSEEDPRISNATSTKQSLTRESGLVVLASDNSTAKYVHGVLETGESAPLPSLPPLPGDEAQVVVNDSFDSWPDRGPLPTGWTGRDLTKGAAVIRLRSGRRGVVQLVGAGDRPPPRVCRGFVPITAGSAQISFDVRVRGSGRTEPVLALIRGMGGDAAQLRFGSRGTFGYFDGARRVISEADWRQGVWYVVTIDLDVAKRTMALTIANDDGTALLRRADVAFPGRATTVDEICFQPAAGAQRPSLELDALVVARTAHAD